MKEENFDPVQAAEFHTEFAVNSDENYEEQGFLWMCGICEDGPTFETVYDLFNHKMQPGHLLQIKKRSEESDCNPDSEAHYAPPSPDIFGPAETSVDPSVSDTENNQQDSDGQAQSSNSVSPPSPTSSEDIPLANLSPKFNSLINKSKDSEKKKDASLKKFQCEKEAVVCNQIGENLSDVQQKSDELLSIENISIKVEHKSGENAYVKHEVKPHEACAEGEKENEQSDQNSLSLERKDDEVSDSDLKNDTKSKDNSSKLRARHICKICNSEFPSRFALSVHKKTHLYKDTGCYRCETCGKMCPKYDNFTRHLTIHFENREKSHECSHCFASFYNLADLKRHLVLHLSVKPYKCEHCGEGFTRQDSLLIHAYKHTGVLCTKYACKDCDKVLNSQSALVMHVKTHSEKTVFCPEPGCKFSCYLQSQLRQHLRKHSGEKPFQCAKCGRCFARSNDMKNHVLNVHEGVRPFKCPACPKEFALVGNLRIHYTTHTNERPYLCAQCGKSFNHPSTLRKHSVTVHSPWRNQDKQSRAKRISSPHSQFSQKSADLKKNKGRRKEMFSKDVSV